jgi:3-dehydroquinate synthase
MIEVPVSLGDRSYRVAVGPGVAGSVAERVAALTKAARIPVVTDANLAALHLPRVLLALRRAGREPVPIILPPGEATKSLSELSGLLDRLLELGTGRGGLIVALGGGVIGDLAGFAAAILKRGVPFVQLPTTLLAMVDSSVGGKTGINMAAGKNLVGAFHQPVAVLADTDFLATLPARELRAGYAEIVKYGLLGDAGFFDWLERHGAGVLGLDGPAVAHAVATSVRAKAAIVAADEEERLDVRALLNLGHTFGHALEAETGYSDRLLHGEAVAVGMAQAFRFSVREGLCPADDAARVEAHLLAAGLPVRLPQPADRLLAHMLNDKKRTEAGLAFILVRGIGRAFLAHEVPLGKVRAFLEEEASA